MSITVRRFGGLATLRPITTTFDIADLDEETRAALLKFLTSERPTEDSSRMPDAYVYEFTIDDPDLDVRELAASGAEVPEALLKLLP